MEATSMITLMTTQMTAFMTTLMTTHIQPQNYEGECIVQLEFSK